MHFLLSFLWFTLFVNSPAFNAGASIESQQISTEKERIFEIDGRKRVYYLHLPPKLTAHAPLVFVLHGYGGDAKSMIAYSKMNEIANQHGFAVCYPQGNFGKDKKNSWNAGYSNDEVDDVKFLTKLAQFLQKENQLSTRNTFCTGMSNGADMSYVLACQAPEVFAAIAPVAGCMMQSTLDACQSAKGVPVFEIHGTADAITKWEGDANYSEKYGGYLGTREIIDFWKKKNACTTTKMDTLFDFNPSDGSYVVSEKHTGGADNQEVRLYQLINGKHDWPGTWGNQDFVASEVIWSFFEQFLRSEEEISVPVGTHFTASTPEAEGVSTSGILSFIERVEKEVDVLHSFMIIRHGKVISKGWWHPYGPENPHLLHSLSKSFTSTAIGLLVDEGKLSLYDRVISFFPEYEASADFKLKSMRIRDLLTMNTGHIVEPRVWGKGDDWVKTFLEAKVEVPPGTHFKYNSTATFMLSVILQKVTGEKLVDYLDTRLFQPLKIKKPDWDVSPNGYNTGGWGLYIRTEDIAKLGQLYLQKGRWNGRQLLSQKWVEMATAKQVSNGSNPQNDWNQGYGFQFWRCRHNCYRGDGAAGQYCIVMPDQDAVVAITSGTDDMGRVMNIVWETLLPAMQNHPLPPNPKQVQALKQKTAQLRLPPINGENSTPLAKKMDGKTFQIAENTAGVKSITFNLQAMEPNIQFAMEHGVEKVLIGSGQYQKSEVQQHLPYTNNLLKKVAASGAWTQSNEYQLRVYLYEMPDRITYTFRVDEEQLIWDSKLERSLFGPKPQEQLVGNVSFE